MGVVIGSGSPRLYIEPSARQTWGSGNQRTIEISFGAKVNGSTSQSWFGYPAEFQIYVNGQWSGSWIRFKGNESWNAGQGLRYFSASMTTDVGTTAEKDITVGIKTVSRGSNNWDGQYTWTFRVGRTNVAPTTPGAITIRENYNGRIISDYFSEKATGLHVQWGRSTDANGDTIYYDLQEQVNGGNWYSVDPSGTDTEHLEAVGGAEGKTYRYWVDARDGSGAHSGGVYSQVVTRNTFTMATLASNSSLSASTDNLTFSYSGGKNTQSGVGINYSITCEGLTVYNSTSSKVNSSTFNVKILKSGSESGPYIRWSDIVSKFGNPSYGGVGTLTFVLTGTNTNGTSKTSKKTINVNIQQKPGVVSGAYISTNSGESTAYKQMGDTKQWYFIPKVSDSRRIRVKWNPASGSIGDTIMYEVAVSYSDGGWQILGTVSNTYYDHIVPEQTTAKTIKYRIRAISSFNSGIYTETVTPPQTLHFYNEPRITEGTITRAASTADVRFTIKVLTSLPSITIKGTWSCNGRSGNIANKQTEQIVSLSGLSENSGYTMTITFNDGTGLTSSNISSNITINANQSIMFVNQYGVGVGGRKASGSFSLDVKGTTRTNSLRLISRNGAIDCDKLIGDEILLCGNSAPNRPSDWSLVRGLGESDSYGLQIGTSYGSENKFYLRSIYDAQRRYKPWAKVYTDKDKPTAKDVGALPITGGTIAGDLICNNYLKLNSYPGSSAGIAQLWFNGNSNSIHIDNAEQLYFRNLGVVKPMINTQTDVSSDSAFAKNGLREGLLDFGNGYGLLYNWFGIWTDGSGQMIRDVNLSPTLARRIDYPLGGCQITTYNWVSWGYAIGKYDTARGIFEVRCADFAGNQQSAGQGQILMLVKLK